MAEKKIVQETDKAEVVIAKAKDFWERNSKAISIVLGVLVVGIGGFFLYNNYVVKPKEEKANDIMFRAEEYYRMDSVNLALNGDGQNQGFLSVIKKYGSTDAGNLACYYAGVCFLKKDDNKNAVTYLKKFSTSSKPIQARVYKLLGDANGDLGNSSAAVEYYKKAAHTFEDDVDNSAEALFLAAYMTDKVLKNSAEAINLYKELKEKFPRGQVNGDVAGNLADIYLAQLGVYNVN